MTDTFENSLRAALERLEKTSWETPLITLENKFRLLPDDHISFRVELLNILWALGEAKQRDDHLELVHLFAIRLAKCDAWTYRFSKSSTRGKLFLNPLTADDSEFTDAIEVSQSNSAYPAEDIIKRWVRDQLA